MQNLMPSVKFYILCISHSIQNFPRVVDAISYYVDLYKSKPQKLPIVKSILPLYSWASPSFDTRGQDRKASVFLVQLYRNSVAWSLATDNEKMKEGSTLWLSPKVALPFLLPYRFCRMIRVISPTATLRSSSMCVTTKDTSSFFPTVRGS